MCSCFAYVGEYLFCRYSAECLSWGFHPIPSSLQTVIGETVGVTLKPGEGIEQGEKKREIKISPGVKPTLCLSDVITPWENRRLGVYHWLPPFQLCVTVSYHYNLVGFPNIVHSEDTYNISSHSNNHRDLVRLCYLKMSQNVPSAPDRTGSCQGRANLEPENPGA